MFFKSVEHTPIIRLSTSSSGRDDSIAYGPGSVINGSLFFKSDQPIQVQKLSIVFQAQVHPHERQKQTSPNILFTITENIQLNQQNTGIAYDDRTAVISAGSHMHLFAIQLPLVNYPPTITKTTFTDACHIDYTLEAILDRSGLPTLASNRISLTYLPRIAVPVNTNDGDGTGHVTRQHSFMMQQQSPNAFIQISASMMQPAYCLGEQCKIQLTTDNPTNDKINQIYITFMTRLWIHQGEHQHLSQTINHHQTFPISVPKQTKNHVSSVSIPIAQHCLPTFDYNNDPLGITLHTDHHIIIGLTHFHQNTTTTTTESAPASSPTSRFFSFGSFHSNTSSAPSFLYLPLTITTMPIYDSKKHIVPLILQHTSQLEPYFISSKPSSPIPTGITKNRHSFHDDDDDDMDDDQYSVSPSSSFKLDDTCTTTSAADRTSVTSSPVPHISSAHLTVPSPSSNSHQSPSGSTIIHMGTS